MQGKLSQVTGATRGIGLGVARALREHGSESILVGRDEEALQRAAGDLGQTAPRVEVSRFDLLQTDEIAPLV